MRHRLRQLAPDLVAVPAGTIQLGTTEAQAAQAVARFGVPPAWCLVEGPPHLVELGAYQIGRAPVTCAEYRAFIVATDHPTPAYWGGDEPPDDLLDHPVVGVSWNDARAYCRWLTAAADRSFRLPSEAEWERAARGADGRVFPWGDGWEAGYCNSGDGGAGATSAVGSYPCDTSPYGCVDMAGNVEEWTSSRYWPYPGSAVPAPHEPAVVVRGGRWDGGVALARAARRHESPPSFASRSRGFRVVCDDA